MKLVIDVPDNVYNAIINNYETFPCETKMWGLKYIKDGIKIPKGHGDLKDVSKIDWQTGCFISSEGKPIPIIHKMATIEMVRWLDTVIEADKDANE